MWFASLFVVVAISLAFTVWFSEDHPETCTDLGFSLRSHW
jgi:hypothetical protein